MSNILSDRFEFKREGDNLLVWNKSRNVFRKFDPIPTTIECDAEDTYISFGRHNFKLFIYDKDEKKRVFEKLMNTIFQTDKINTTKSF